MDLSSHINDILINFPKYTITQEDKKLIETDKALWITKKLFRKKFRKTKIYETTFNDILKKVTHSIENNIPIQLVILFGWYKHFWNESHPFVDRAEFFNIKFMSELVSPVLEIHTPGIKLDYASEDIIITKMNNYPRSSLNKYAKSFQQLINTFSQYFPSNFSIKYTRTGEMYDTQKLLSEVEKRLPESRNERNKLSETEQKLSVHRSKRSIMRDGEEDRTQLNEQEKKQKIIESRLVEQLFYIIEDELIGEYYYWNEHIPLVLSRGLSDENIFHRLTLGSTSSCVVDFWIGRGILEIRDNKIIPKIVSKTQYEKIKNNITTTPITNKLSKINDNFTKINTHTSNDYLI